MKQISNRTLSIFLIAAIAVTLGSTMISLNKINQLIGGQGSTGFATSMDGYVNVSVISVASIQLVDQLIDFGACTPNISTSSSPGANLSSNISTGSWGDDTGICSRTTETDNITIKNDGNAYVNISVQTDTLASTFIGGDDPWGPGFYFKSQNATTKANAYGPGCRNLTIDVNGSYITGLANEWQNFSQTSYPYHVCDNLSFSITANAIEVYAKLEIPSNAPPGGEQNVSLTFTATELP